MRRKGASPFVPNDAITDIGTFQGVVSIILKDGQITREEKRLVIKLASLLNLDTDAPKRVYDAVVTGGELEDGNKIGRTKCLEVYAGMFQTAYLNASISEDEYLVVAYLRHLFDITDEENELVMNDIRAELEEHVKKNAFQVVEKGFEQAKDVVDGLFDKIRSILPEGGAKGDEG